MDLHISRKIILLNLSEVPIQINRAANMKVHIYNRYMAPSSKNDSLFNGAVARPMDHDEQVLCQQNDPWAQTAQI